MSAPVLVIGNKAYSSWSMRPWVLMRHFGIAFREVRISLYDGNWRQRILEYSPSGKVPALTDGDVRVWESLAIAEYLAEKHAEKTLWPRDATARATARAVSAEMHAGFAALRSGMPMNVRRRFPDKGRSREVLADIERITALWRDCRSRFGAGGEFLFGAFSIADAMYAPVVSRLITYQVEVDDGAAAYVRSMSALPSYQAWVDEALRETETISHYEL